MKPLMVSGLFPCVRAGKITEALREPHDALCRAWPPQFTHAYDVIHALRCGTQRDFAEFFARHDGEYDIIHVHNEPNWPVIVAKEAQSAPVIMNVHDVTSARPSGQFDPYEKEAYEAADAFVFISEEQRKFTIDLGFDVERKPYCVLANYASDSTIIEKPLLPHIGGIVYLGGLDARGQSDAWRDLSDVSDAFEKHGHVFHIYPGNPGIDYGTVHPSIMEYGCITPRIAQHDWGFTGTNKPNHAWEHSYPNKVFEYLAAGIPFVALNNPLLIPLAEEGLGVYLSSLDDIPRFARENPKPYVKRVKEQRHRFTMSYNIQPLKELYATLRGK